MKIEKLDNKGRGITYYNDLIMFVNNALPEEDVEVSNIKEFKKYYEAEASKIHNKSKNRVTPKCPYYDFCGGCNIMHTTHECQTEFKKNKVSEILSKYAGINEPIKYVYSNTDLFYRNKITFKVENGVIGLYNANTHNLCEINRCLIANNTINEFIDKLNIFEIKNGEITLRTNYLKEILISIYSSDTVKINYDAIPSNVKGIVINNKTIYKDSYFIDKIDDLEFKVSYNSFFQINNFVAGEIFKILRNNLTGKNLLDLYCGVGTLGLALKDKYKNIYGIEKIDNAIIDAKYNAKMNGVTNHHYYAGDTGKILNKLNMKFDTIIVDPPRSGLNGDTIKQLIELNPKNICYISCDPMTLARDLKILKEHYCINKIYALDMFPNTYHVETICIMKKL